MAINKDDLTGREIRILVAALQSHSDTLGEMMLDKQYDPKHRGELAKDVLATETLLKSVKRRARR
jgi:hypothetical protein